jgi:hypothetical protein
MGLEKNRLGTTVSNWNCDGLANTGFEREEFV